MLIAAAESLTAMSAGDFTASPYAYLDCEI